MGNSGSKEGFSGMTETKELDGIAEDGSSEVGVANGEQKRRPYSRPMVLSAESLEAAAATCDPSLPGAYGKTRPTCGILGS